MRETVAQLNLVFATPMTPPRDRGPPPPTPAYDLGALHPQPQPLASVLATILAMTTGFNTVILVGLCCYLIGITAFLRVPSAAAITASSAIPRKSPVSR